MNRNVLKSILLAAATGGALALFTAPVATAVGLAAPYGPVVPYAAPHPPPRFVPWRQNPFAWRALHPAGFQGGRTHRPYPGPHHRAAAPSLVGNGAPSRGPYARVAPPRWRALAPAAARLAARSTHRPGRYDPYAAWRGPAARQTAWAPPAGHPAVHYRWRPVQPPGDAFWHRFAANDPRAPIASRHYRFRPWGGPRGRAPVQPVLAGFHAPHSGRAGLPYRFRPLGPGAARPLVAAFTRPASGAMPLHGAPGPFGFRPLAQFPRRERPVAGLPSNRGRPPGLAQAEPRLHYRFRPDPRFHGGRWSRVPSAPQPDAPAGQGRFAGGDRLAMSLTAPGLPDPRSPRDVTGGDGIH